MTIETMQKYYSCERVMLLDISFMDSEGWEVLFQDEDKLSGDFRVVYEKR